MTDEEQSEIINLAGEIEMQATAVAEARISLETAKANLSSARHKLFEFTQQIKESQCQGK